MNDMAPKRRSSPIKKQLLAKSREAALSAVTMNQAATDGGISEQSAALSCTGNSKDA